MAVYTNDIYFYDDDDDDLIKEHLLSYAYMSVVVDIIVAIYIR